MKSSILLTLAMIAPATSSPGETLTLISPHWEGIRYEFAEGFQRSFQRQTGRNIDLRWIDIGGASDILRYIRSEFGSKPKGIGIDLFFGGGTEPFRELKTAGYLQAYRLPQHLLNGLAADINGAPLYDPEYTWYSATMSGFGILYNRWVIERLGLPEPKTWKDLARPEVLGWVGSADPRKSGSVHMTYEIILQAYGWDEGWKIITAMGANVRGFSATASQTPKDVAVGEVAYGLSIDSYAWNQIREVGEGRLGFVMPERLSVMNGDAIAILKGAPEPELAKRFLRYVLSPEGQKLWMLARGTPGGPQRYELGRFSVRPALYDELGETIVIRMNPFQWKSDFLYDDERGGARWTIVNDLLGTQIIDTHPKLVSTWERTISEHTPWAEISDMARPPISEEDVASLADGLTFRDARERNRLIQEWTRFARAKYLHGSRWTALLRTLPSLTAMLFVIAGIHYFRRSSN